MSDQLLNYLKENIDEIKRDVKDIKKTVHGHDKDLALVKWKQSIIGAIGGAIMFLALKITGIFHQ